MGSKNGSNRSSTTLEYGVWRSTAFLATLAAACGGPLDPPVESSESAINGTVTTVDCSPAAKKKLKEAGAYLKSLLDGAPTKSGKKIWECIKDSFISPAVGEAPNTILNRLKEKLSTKVECVKPKNMDCPYSGGLAGCANYDLVGKEEIQLDPGFIEGSTTIEVAGLFVHEVLHNKGYKHLTNPKDYEYDYSVTQQVRNCVVNGKPKAGPERSMIPHEVELARTGGGMSDPLLGEPFKLAKGGDWFVSGFGANYDNLVRAIKVKLTNTSSGDKDQKQVVANGASTKIEDDASCASNQVVTGLYGKSGDALDRFGFFCGSLALLKQGKKSAQKRNVEWGGNGGNDFTLKCPAGMAVRAIAGRKSDQIDQIGVVCRSVTTTKDYVTMLSAPLLGKKTGFRESRSCMGFGAMVGLFGRKVVAPQRLGGICAPLKDKATNSFDLVLNKHITPASGGRAGDPVDVSCPTDRALVGIKARVANSDNQILRLRGICVRPSEWSGKANASKSSFAETGAIGEPSDKPIEESLCPSGYLVNGLDVWSKAKDGGDGKIRIYGVRPICAWTSW